MGNEGSVEEGIYTEEEIAAHKASLSRKALRSTSVPRNLGDAPLIDSKTSMPNSRRRGASKTEEVSPSTTPSPKARKRPRRRPTGLDTSYGTETDPLARALSGTSSRNKPTLSGRNGLVMGSDVIVGSSLERDNFDAFGNEKKPGSEKEVESEKQTVNGQKIENKKPSDREDAVNKASNEAPTSSEFAKQVDILIGKTGGSTRPGRTGRGRRGRGENAGRKYDEAASLTNPFIDAMRHSALRTQLRGQRASGAEGADEQHEELKKQVAKLKQEREKDKELFARQKSLLEEAAQREKTKRRNIRDELRQLQNRINGKKSKNGLNSFMKNDQEKWITDLKADNVRLKRDNDKFVASMEAKVNEHLEKTQAQLLRDCENMKNEISEMKEQETELESQLSEAQKENTKLEDKFLALYADKGGDDMLGHQMKETIAKLRARLETQTELNKFSHKRKVAYQDALGNAQNNMRDAQARQEEYLERAKAANQSQIEFAESEIEARDTRIDKLQKELSFLSNNKRVLEAFRGAKEEADALADELAESAQQLEDVTQAGAKAAAAHVAAMQELKANMVTVRKEKSRLNSEIEKLQQNLEKRVSENETTRANLATLQERANELQEKVESVVAQKAELKRRAKERLAIAKASAEKQSKELTEQMQANDLKATAEMSAAQQQWKTKEEAMSADRAKVEAALEERAKELQKLESDLIEQQAASTAALESQSKAHSTALDTVQVERDKVLEEHAQALQEQQVLEQFKIMATAAASESAKERDRLQADLTSHQEQLKGANADIASHLEKLKQSEAAAVELQKSKAEVQSNLEKMTETANKHSATSTARATEIAECTQQLSDMTGKAQNLESELRKAFDSAATLQAEKEALVTSVSTHSERVMSLEASIKQQEVTQAAALENLQASHADQVKSREAALIDAKKQHSAHVDSLNADAEKRIAGLQDEWAQKLATAANDSAAALSSLQQEFQAQQQTHKGAIQDAESSHAAAVGALTQQVVELKETVEQKDVTVSTQAAKMTELDTLLQTSKAEWEARKVELTEVVQQRSQELEDKTFALAGVEKDLAEHQQQLESRTAELEAQKAAIASGETQAGVLRGQLQSAESALAEQKTLLDKEKAALVSESQKAEKLQADLDAELKRAQKLSDSLKAATTEHAEEVSKLHGVLQTQIEDGKAIAAKAATDLEEVKAAHQQTLSTLKQQMETTKAAHNAETVKLKEELSKLNGSLDVVKAELDLAKNELKASGADAANMSAKMATLKKGTLLAKRAGEQEREAAELEQKKLALKVKARKTQLDAARMSLLLVSAAGLFEKSSDNETNHFDVLKKCAASKQVVSVLQGVECEGELKDWHTDATRNLSSFVESVLEDMMTKRKGLMKANQEVATRAEELTTISAQLSIATHTLADAYQEEARIQSSMHKAELAEDSSVASLRAQYEGHVATLKPLEQKQEEVLNALLTASDHDKVHGIVARRDFTGQEWTDQLKVSAQAASEGLQRAMDALAESKKLVKAAGQASTEAERKKAAMQMKRMMAKQKKQMEKDAQRASELREAETKKLMAQLEQAEKQKQEQALQVQHMSADQKLAAEEAARRHAAQTEELRKALEARQAAAKAELAAKEAELKKEMEAKAAQLAAELAAKNDAEARERLEAERRRKEAAELAAKREKDAAELSKQLQDKEAILNSINLLSVGDVKDKSKAKMIEQMREARRKMALEKSAAAAAKAQKKTKDDMTSLTSELSQLKASVEAQVRAAGESNTAKQEMSEEIRNALGNSKILVEAAEDGDWHEVEKLLDEGLKPNGYDLDGYTPLIMGCHAGMETAVEILLERGARVNFPAADKSTACHVAVQAGHMNILDLLLEKKPNVNMTLGNGATPLFIAAQEGHLWAVNMLMEAGADPDIHLSAGATPLFMATQEGHYEIVQVLLQSGASVNMGTSNGATPLFISAQNGRQSILELLIECECDLETGPRQQKPAAADKGDKEKAPEYEYITPLFVACNSGHHEVAQSLLKAKANPNASFAGFVPLLLSGFRGDTYTIRDLIDAGADSSTQTRGGWSIAEIMQEVHGVSYQEVLEGKNLHDDERDDDDDSEGTYHSSDEEGEDSDGSGFGDVEINDD